MPGDKSTKKRLGDFEVIRELGRGGMGIVYEARQVSLNRKVALKVISGSLGLSSKAVLRFQREAEAAGKLHHTNIVPIYSTGQDDGAHYYAMELIDGPSLHRVIRSLRSGDRKGAQVSGSAATLAVGAEQVVSTGDSVLDSSGAVETPAWVSEILGSPPLSGKSTPAPSSNVERGSTSRTSSGSHVSSSYFDTVATMIAGVSDGLDYAHENGVIHRDIKPANLLLSRDGRVSINDFGLARMLEQPGMTMSGEFVGSPLYMSPEQITAGRAPLDHRTDIYSLGATLYELLTLKPVFPGTSRDEVIAQILHKEPERPRRLNPKVPVDLETVCLKAMEKDPDRRYQTAGQLAEDLRRFVSRHAISARRIGPVGRAVRWVRRNRAIAATTSFALAVTIVAASFLYQGWLEKREIRRMQVTEEMLIAAMSGEIDKALRARSQAGDLGVSTTWELMIDGQVALFEGRSSEALSRFGEAVRLEPESVMAQSMLADAYLRNGLWGEFVAVVEQIERLQVRSDDDLLFKGVALVSLDPEKAREAIDEVVRKRPSFAVARIWLAVVKARLAVDHDDKAEILDALEEFEALTRFRPDLDGNPLLATGRLNARLAAYRFCDREARREGAREEDRERARADAEGFLREAKSDVDQLERFPKFAAGNWSRLQYYEFQSDLDSMGPVMNAMAAAENSGYVVGPYAASFFRFGKQRIQEALNRIATLRDQKDPYVVWARTVLLSETPEGRKKAGELLDDVLESFPKEAALLEDVLSILILRGRRTGARDYIRSRIESLGESKYLPINRDGLRYLVDDLPESDLIRRYGKTAIHQPDVHFLIGLIRLTEGERDEAKAHFKKGGDSLHFGHPMSLWSRAFLTRLEEDDTWPDWLPVEPVAGEK